MSKTPSTREQQLSAAFVTLADTLVNGYDVVDLMHLLTNTCVDLLHCDEAGLMLADQRGNLRVMASSSERMRLVELFELQNADGPCLDSFQNGTPISASALADTDERWPRFSPAAREAGFVSVQALPLRLRSTTIGALNLFFTGTARMTDDDVAAAQALADVATIGILQQRTVHRSDLLAEQLQMALNSRLTIEQAKGVLAERGGLGVDQAFTVIRDYCRSNRLTISATARRIVGRDLDPDVVLAGHSVRSSGPGPT
jgi:GAF domain-containing protein